MILLWGVEFNLLQVKIKVGPASTFCLSPSVGAFSCLDSAFWPGKQHFALIQSFLVHFQSSVMWFEFCPFCFAWKIISELMVIMQSNQTGQSDGNLWSQKMMSFNFSAGSFCFFFGFFARWRCLFTRKRKQLWNLETCLLVITSVFTEFSCLFPFVVETHFHGKNNDAFDTRYCHCNLKIVSFHL